MTASIWMTEDLAHEKFASGLFAEAHQLMSKEDRSQDDNDRMLHAAHASCYHFSLSGNPRYVARGEWLVSKAYAVLKRGHQAFAHARRSLEICMDNGIRDHHLAFAYESLARATMVQRKKKEMARYRYLAESAGNYITEIRAREEFDRELSTIPEEIPLRRFLSDDHIRKQLEARPAIREATFQLFHEARSSSEVGFYVAVLDLTRTYLRKRAHLTCDISRSWAIGQIAEFMSRVSESPAEHDDETAEFLRYLQILAYSQFWECRGIQRLLRSLTRIVAGKPYDPRLLLDTYTTTSSLWISTMREAGRNQLLIGDLIKSIYYSVIRNHFVHSDFLIDHGSIFDAPDTEQGGDAFSISFQTWDNLFEAFRTFVKTLFELRREAVRDLEKIQPYRVSLPGFSEPFFLEHDEGGMWRARPESLDMSKGPQA